MKRAEYKRLLEEKEAARKRFREACPDQVEHHGAVWISWRADNSLPSGYQSSIEGENLEYGLVGLADGVGVLLRLVEIRDALEAWSRNEGDWPLAKAGK